MNNQLQREMETLVSGGGGFIGGHLVERLLKEGYKVKCLDSLNDYYNPAIRRNNIKAFLRRRKF